MAKTTKTKKPGSSKKKSKAGRGNASAKASRSTSKKSTRKQPANNAGKAGKTTSPKTSKSKSAVAIQPTLEPVSNPVHVLIRVRSEDGTTISEHYRVLEDRGRALIGKVGKALGDKFIDELNRQIASGAETHLFLTTKDGWGGAAYTTYQCGLEAVHKALPPGKRDLVPDYYASEYDSIGSWFEVTSMYELSRDQMNSIEVVSSGRSIMSVIKSMASVFRVRVP